MDPKASAKSKRTHSQHGRKNHPPPASTAHKKKTAAAAAAAAERSHRTESHGLPSNWDRYDADATEGFDRAAGTKDADGGVAPKSKGADFGFLINEARSQSRELRNPALQSSFDDLSFDFMQGVGSMLSVRGKGLLSYCDDDNFVVDDDHTSNDEVPFLSMDLRALATQITKLKLSQRLFIEPDLLPEELHVDDSKKSTLSEQSEVSKISELERRSDLPAIDGFPVKESNLCSQMSTCSSRIPGDSEMTQGAVTQTRTSQPLSTNIQLPASSKPPKQPFRKEAKESISQIRDHALPDLEVKNNSRFEAAAAEAELDMLLNSITETNLSDSLAGSLINNNPSPDSLNYGLMEPMGSKSNQDPGPLGDLSTSSLHNSLDDLLTETSSCLEVQKHKHTSQVQERAVFSKFISPMDSRSVPVSASSRGADTFASVDDSIDDLLTETTLWLGDQKKNKTLPRKEGATLPSLGSHASSLASKVTDDFDSWLDEL